MFGLDYLGLTTLLVLASVEPSGMSAQSCAMAPPRPVVTVTMSESVTAFDISKSAEELSEFDIDTVSPYPAQYHTEIGGLMTGEMDLVHRITFGKSVDFVSGRGCIWFSAIEVNIHTAPTIFVASDFKDNKCRFGEVFKHEVKHVTEDRALLEKYTDEISDRLNVLMGQPVDYTSGFIPLDDMEQTKNDMQMAMEFVLGVMFEKMMTERTKRQQSIDSLEEYTRVSGAC